MMTLNEICTAVDEGKYIIHSIQHTRKGKTCIVLTSKGQKEVSASSGKTLAGFYNLQINPSTK